MSLALPGLGGGGTNIILTQQNSVFPNWGTMIDASGTNNINGYGIKVDFSGNIYVTGIIDNQGATQINLSGLTITRPHGTYDSFFIAKYDINGIPQWGTIINDINKGNNYGFTSGLSIDYIGNVYITVSVNQASTNLSGLTVTRPSNIKNTCILIAKYNINGVAQWGTFIGSDDGRNFGRGIAVDSNRNIYIAGYIGNSTSTQVILSGISTTLNISRPSNTGSKCFIAKYDTSGNPQWGRIIDSSNQITDSQFDNCNNIDVDSSGDVYIIGNISTENSKANSTIIDLSYGIIITRPSNRYTGCLIAKYNTSGIPQWCKIIDSNNNENNYGNGIVVDLKKNVYVTGIVGSNGATTIDLSGLTITRPSSRGQGYLIAKYDTYGNPQWGKIIDSVATLNDSGNGISVDSIGNVYITGYVADSTSIDLSGLIINKQSGRGSGCLIAKYNTNGIPQWGTIIDSSGSDDDAGYGITVDSNQNVYVTGGIGSSGATQLNLSGLTITRPSGRGCGCVIAKYFQIISQTYLSGTYSISSGIISFSWGATNYIQKPITSTLKYTLTNTSNNSIIVSKISDTSYSYFNELPNTDTSYNYKLRLNARMPAGSIVPTTTLFIPGYYPNNFSVNIISPIEISFNFYLHPSMNQYVSNVSLQYNPKLSTISNTIVTQTSLPAGTAAGMNSIYTDKLVPDTSYGNTIDYDFTYNIRGLQARSPWTKEFRTPRFDDPSSVGFYSITSNSITIQFNKTTNYSWLLISGENRASYTVNQSGGDISYSIGNIGSDGTKYMCVVSGLNSNTSYDNIFNVRALYRYGYFTETTAPAFTTAVSPIVITLIEPTASSVKITWTLSGPSLGTLLSQSIVGTDVISIDSSSSTIPYSITISGLFAAKIYNDWTLSTTFMSSTGPIRTPIKQFATLVDFATVGAITPKIYVDAQYFSNTISGVKTTKDISYQLSDTTRWISQYNSATISGAFYTAGGATYPTYNNDGSYSYVRFGTNTSSTISGNYLNFGPQTYNINSSGLTIIGVGRFYSTERGIAERIIDINDGNDLFPSVTINRDYSGSIVTTDNIGYYTLFTSGGNNTFNSIIQQNVIAPTKWIIFGGRYTSNTISYLTDSSNVSVIKSETLPSIVSDLLFSNTYIAKSAVIYSGTTFVDTYSNLDVRDLMFFDGTMNDASFAAIGQQLYNKYNSPPAYTAAKNAATPSPLTASNITAVSADISFTIAEKAANITNITITPLPNGTSVISSLPLTGSSPYTVTLSGIDASSTYTGLSLNVFYGGITSFTTPINSFNTLRITRTTAPGASLQYVPTYDISTLTVKHAWNPSGYTFVPANPAIKYSIDLCGALAYSNLSGTSYNEPSTRSNLYDTSYNYRLYTTNVSGELTQSVALKIPGLVPAVIFPLATLQPTSTDISFYLDPSLNSYLSLTDGIKVIIKDLGELNIATYNYSSQYSSNGYYNITGISGLIPNTSYRIIARSTLFPDTNILLSDPTFTTPSYNSSIRSTIIYSAKPTSCDISFTVNYAKDLSSLSISGMPAGVTSNIGSLTVPSELDVQSYGITLSGLVPGTTYNTVNNRMQIVARFGAAATYSSVTDLSFRTVAFDPPNGFNAFNFNRTSCDISFRIPTYANMLTDLSVVGISSLILSKPSIPVNLTDTSATYIISLSGLTSGPYTNISFGAIYGIYRAFSAFTFNIPVFNSTFSLTASSITQNSMIISWTSPNPSYTISGITINWQTGSTTIGTNSYTISGLSPSTSYTITVTEIYANGLSASGTIIKSTFATFVSTFTINSDPPLSTSINIKYSNPNPQYTLNNYTIYYQISGAATYIEINNVSNTTTSYNISGLTLSTKYNIYMVATYSSPLPSLTSNTLNITTISPPIFYNSSYSTIMSISGLTSLINSKGSTKFSPGSQLLISSGYGLSITSKNTVYIFGSANAYPSNPPVYNSNILYRSEDTPFSLSSFNSGGFFITNISGQGILNSYLVNNRAYIVNLPSGTTVKLMILAITNESYQSNVPMNITITPPTSISGILGVSPIIEYTIP